LPIKRWSEFDGGQTIEDATSHHGQRIEEASNRAHFISISTTDIIDPDQS
jgi:hypothetical protein